MRNLFTLKYVIAFLFLQLSFSLSSAQTIIGSFPQMDGGFENQTSGTIATLSSIANGIQRTDWTVSAGSGSALINSSNGRSGPKYFTVGSSSTTARRFQSPTAANGAILNTTVYTTQFYYKTTSTTAVSTAQSNVSADGTGSGGTYQALSLNGTSGSWTKVQQSVTSSSSANATKYGLSLFRFSGISTVDVDIDDYVVYAGAADNTAASTPGTVTVSVPTLNSLDVNWVAASGGVDGGGYIVVRYSTNPNADNDPNQNGIYSIGNINNNGTGSLTGTIRYIGMGTSFTDNIGLSSSQTYYYKVYTVDKAFNYSAESIGSGTTSTPVTPTLTASSLADFGNVCINTTGGPNTFTLNGVNLDGSDVVISGLSGLTYSTSLSGTYTSTLTLGSGTTYPITIYVGFTPTSVSAYSGNINISGGGAAGISVAASGTGFSGQTTTASASSVTSTTAILNGIINSSCTSVTSYGFEYSTATGFMNGSGTLIPSNNLTGGTFSTTVTGLLPNTRYYFKAFATNSIGTTYGAQQAFTNTPLPVLISAAPNLSYTQTFSDVGTWGSFFTSGNGANHFGGLSATASAPASGVPSPTVITASSSNFNSNTFSTSSGIHRFIDSATAVQSIIFLSTGSGSSPNFDNTSSTALDFYMDFTGLNAGTLSFDYATINNSSGNRNGSFRVYTTTDGTLFDTLSFANILNFTNNSPISGSKTNIQLPASFNNSSTARLRFYYHNGSGNTGSGSRPKISIDNLTVTGLATTPCTQPTAPATSLGFGTITDTTIAASFTAASPSTDNYLIVMSTNSALISNPANGQIYNIGSNVGDGSVIAKGSGTSFIATGLTALTTYYFFVFPMNAVCTGGPLYYTATVLNGNATTIAGLPTCVAPTSQPSNLIFGSSTTNSINGSFTATAADQYMVVRSLSSSLGANPVNAVAYNTGDAVGNGKVVQRNSATSFTANGLAPNTNYFFFIYSLNNQGCINGPVYNITAPLSSSHSTIPLPPCTTPTEQGSALSLATSNHGISGTFTGVNSADNYLIIKSTNPTLGATPADNVDYNAGDVFGNGTVVNNVSITTFYAIGLTANTQYYFFIFAVNKFCSGGTKYNTLNPLNGNISTTNIGVNNYYFGTLHSHSDYSDGNKDYPGYTPAQDYDFAKTSLCMDYLGISEHNHFSSPDNPGNQVNNFHKGAIQADSVTLANPNFLAMYGMEWGVISGGGHVVIYGNGMDDLWGWETGAGNWGPTSNYDIYVPKSVYTGNTGLFKTVNDNIAKNTFATLAHPNLTDYNNIAGTAYDAVADNAIVGAAVESGPAFSTNTSYSNPGSSLSYLFYYQLLLSKGYHLGPTIDHDNHYTTFGRTTTSRTAIVSPALDKISITGAMRKMNFYTTQDCDTKVDFTINTKIMGTSLSNRFGPNIYVSLSDPTTSLSGAIIRIMYGEPGSGVYAVKIDSAIGSSLKFTDNNLANLSTGYYYLDITNGTSRIITSPIWYTRNDALTALPVKLNSFTVQKANTSAQLDWSTAQEINSSYFNIEKSTDGRNWTSIAKVNAAGNSTTVKNYRAFDNNPLNGINYYRLKQYDTNGKFEYSVVKSISFSKAYSIIVAPNPSKYFINIFTTKNQSIILTIQLVDVSGKILKTVLSADDNVKMNVIGIAKGLYFIKVKDQNTIQTQKVIIE